MQKKCLHATWNVVHLVGTFLKMSVLVKQEVSFNHLLNMKSNIYIPLAVAVLATTSASAAWQRIGGLDKRPTDLASTSINDVSVSSSSGGIAQPENLLSDNVALSTRLEAGSSEVVIRVHRQTDIFRVAFANDGVEGRVAILASADEKNWTPVTQSVFTSADRQVTAKFANVQSKYLKLQFDLAKGGSVRALSVFSTDSEEDFPVQDGAPDAPHSVNIAGGLGGTRVIYIHPNTSGSEDLGVKYNRFEFPESPEKFRTVIYDFGHERQVSEVGSVHSTRPVRLYAYTFRDRELPEKEDWRGRMSFDPTAFDTQKPAAVVEDSKGSGYAKARFDRSVRARYVALRWEPDFNPPGFGVSAVTILVKTTSNATFNAAGAGANTNPNTQTDENGNKDGTQGDAATTAVTNPFAFTSGGSGSGSGTGGTGTTVAPPPAARPTPRPRSP